MVMLALAGNVAAQEPLYKFSTTVIGEPIYTFGTTVVATSGFRGEISTLVAESFRTSRS